MKKSLLLLATMGMGAIATAQTESAFMDAVALLGEGAADEAVAVSAGTELCASASVSMQAAWDDTYKIVAMAGSSDAQQGLAVDGVFYDLPKGVQGQTNPKENSLMFGGQQSGAVFKFEVKQDGVLYVFGKLTYNKNYYVWEGDVANSAASPVAYTLTAFTAADGTKAHYTLPGDDLGYYVIGSGYDDYDPATEAGKYLNAAQCTEIYNGGDPSNLTIWTAGNALGVIAFPVYAEAGEYYVNACGSKVTCDGFVFVPGTETIAEVSNEGGDVPGPAEEKCIVVSSKDMVEAAWDTQFWVISNEVLHSGDAVTFKADVKATKEAAPGTQYHKAPGEYLHWAAVGNVTFTTEWTTYEFNGTVPAEAEGAQSIAFNLNDFAEANDYYFKNISFVVNGVEMVKNGDLSGDDMSSFAVKIDRGGIEEATASALDFVQAESANTVSYNLFGQKTNATTGLMIRNGKLILVK